MNTGITGVDPPYRRQGIATAMKVRTFEFVKQLGKSRIEAPFFLLLPPLAVPEMSLHNDEHLVCCG
jgi:GNAT superfamily N-acetyltransferase